MVGIHIIQHLIPPYPTTNPSTSSRKTHTRSARSAPPRDTPTGRNLMTRHGGDFRTTRSGSLKKKCNQKSLEKSRVFFRNPWLKNVKNLNRSIFPLLYPQNKKTWNFAATRKTTKIKKLQPRSELGPRPV